MLPLNCMRRMFYLALIVCTVCLLWCPNVSLEWVLLSAVHVHQCLTKKILMIVCPECTWLILKNILVLLGYFFIVLWLLSGNTHSCPLNVLWSTASCRFFAASFNSSELFYKCRIIRLGANCDKGECVFRSFWGVYNLTKPHCEAKVRLCEKGELKHWEVTDSF